MPTGSGLTKAQQLVAAYREVAGFGHFLVAIGPCSWTSDHIDEAEAILRAAGDTGALDVLESHRASYGRFDRVHV